MRKVMEMQVASLRACVRERERFFGRRMMRSGGTASERKVAAVRAYHGCACPEALVSSSSGVIGVASWWLPPASTAPEL